MIYVIIKSNKIFPPAIYFSSLESARNYVKMRVPTSHRLKELPEEPNVFVSKAYGSKYSIIGLENYEEVRDRVVKEFDLDLSSKELSVTVNCPFCEKMSIEEIKGEEERKCKCGASFTIKPNKDGYQDISFTVNFDWLKKNFPEKYEFYNEKSKNVKFYGEI